MSKCQYQYQIFKNSQISMSEFQSNVKCQNFKKINVNIWSIKTILLPHSLLLAICLNAVADIKVSSVKHSCKNDHWISGYFNQLENNWLDDALQIQANSSIFRACHCVTLLVQLVNPLSHKRKISYFVGYNNGWLLLDGHCYNERNGDNVVLFCKNHGNWAENITMGKQSHVNCEVS